LTWNAILWLRVVFVILTLSFTVMTFVSFWSRNIVTKIAYRAAAIWTGFLMYLFFAALAYGVLIFFNNMFLKRGSLAGIPIHSYAFGFSKFGLALLAVALFAGVYGVIHARKTVVTRVSVKLPDSSNQLNVSDPSKMATAWKNKKAVWISDIHLGHVRGVKFLEKTVKKIQELKPDLVFIGGDLFDGTKIDADAAIVPLRDLCAPTAGLRTPHVVSDGVYFVMGNHEEFSELNAVRFLNSVKKIPGLRVLEDEVVTVDGVDIIGVDHGHVDTAEKFSKVLERLAKVRRNSQNGIAQHPSILLKHEPTDLDVAVRAGVSLQISGHTHKGQVWPATWLAWLVFPGYNYGLHERGAMQVYTSSGVGTWGPPLRVGSKSEIVLFEFE
jgi:predicted MPP superfamily phosphohydrolase